jgi:hypothetical protein
MTDFDDHPVLQGAQHDILNISRVAVFTLQPD